jgi:hypothetical protein
LFELNGYGFRLLRRERRLKLQRKRCDPFRRPAYVGGDFKMRPSLGCSDPKLHRIKLWCKSLVVALNQTRSR